MIRFVVTGAGLLVVLLVAELAAVALATRFVSDALGRCLPFESVTVEHVRRPVVPRLLVGRARDVELVAEGVRFDDLRVERAHMVLPLALAPWAPYAPDDPPPAQLTLTASETDLGEWLDARAPLGIRPTLELTPGVAAIGLAPFPSRVRLAVEVTDAGLRLAPVGRLPGWFASLGLDLAIALPERLRVDALAVVEGALTTSLQVDVVAGVDGSAGCEGPLVTEPAAAGSEPSGP